MFAERTQTTLTGQKNTAINFPLQKKALSHRFLKTDSKKHKQRRLIKSGNNAPF